jgi:hypothetical protein
MGRPTLEGLELVGKVGLQFLRGEDRTAAETVGRWVFQRQRGGTAWDELFEDLKEIWRGNAGVLEVELLRPSLHNLAMDWVLAKTIADIAVPTTFILGDDSHPMRHRAHESLSAALPDMSTVRAPGSVPPSPGPGTGSGPRRGAGSHGRPPHQRTPALLPPLAGTLTHRLR